MGSAIENFEQKFSCFPIPNDVMRKDAIDYLSDIEGVPEDVWNEYDLIYYGAWHTDDESDSLLILCRKRRYYVLIGGHCVLDANYQDEKWSDLGAVTKDDALVHCECFQGNLQFYSEL